ncbi:MAG: ABC transporter substrate-binding protein, partial [Salinirussus sp.]
MNVVSTSPSATEILYAIGVEPVAVSHACDYPPEVDDKPVIDTSQIGGESSGERHAQTEAAAADGHVYSVHAERLRAADPDLIITQEVCGVCAVDTTAVDHVLSDLQSDPEVLALDANRLEDLFDCIETVGRATGHEAQARTLVSDLRARLGAIEDRVESRETTPSVTVIEWMDPV